MADWAPVTRDPEILTEYVRHALARTISAGLAANGVIPLITLAKPVEDVISKSIQHKEIRQLPGHRSAYGPKHPRLHRPGHHPF